MGKPTNRPVKSQKQARSLKFRILEETLCFTKTKALIRFAANAKLICIFVFAFANCWFYHAAAHMFSWIGSDLGRLRPERLTNNQMDICSVEASTGGTSSPSISLGPKGQGPKLFRHCNSSCI